VTLFFSFLRNSQAISFPPNGLALCRLFYQLFSTAASSVPLKYGESVSAPLSQAISKLLPQVMVSLFFISSSSFFFFLPPKSGVFDIPFPSPSSFLEERAHFFSVCSSRTFSL